MYHGNLEITENGYWVEANDLRVGDVFLGANGELSTLINAVRVEQEGGIAVFNFTVEGNHNYFILAKDFAFGQSCILVHNALGYRAVSQAEYEDIVENGFRQAKNSMPGKWFATTPEGAEAFKIHLSKYPDPPTRIIGGQIDDALIHGPFDRWDGIADAFYVYPENLSMIKVVIPGL